MEAVFPISEHTSNSVLFLIMEVYHNLQMLSVLLEARIISDAMSCYSKLTKFSFHIFIVQTILMDPPNPVFEPLRQTRAQKRPREAGSEAEAEAGGSTAATKTRRTRARVNLEFPLYTTEDKSTIRKKTAQDKKKDCVGTNTAFNTRATKKKNEKKSSNNTQLKAAPPPNKYSGLTLVAMRNIMKSSGVKGLGSMKKDELLQLCLLYNPDVPSSLPSKSKTPTSNTQTRLELTNEFRESLDEEDRRESSDEDLPIVRNRRKVLRFSSPEQEDPAIILYQSPNRQISEVDLDDLPSATDLALPGSAPLGLSLTASKSEGRQKQTPDPSEVSSHRDLPSRERGTALPRPAPTDLSGRSGSRSTQNTRPDCHESDDSDWDPREGSAPLASVSTASKGKGKQKQTPDDFPSRERGTALPRPAPTDLSGRSGSRSTRNTRPDCHESDDSDWDPIRLSEDEDSEHDDDNSPAPSQDPNEYITPTDKDSMELDNGPESIVERILGPQRTQSRNVAATPNADDSADLREQVQSLTQAVRELAKNMATQNNNVSGNVRSGGSGQTGKRKCSAEFLGRIRGHVRKLMGLRENEDIPASATRAQMSSWKLSTTKGAMLSSVNPNHLQQICNEVGSDPRFPYKGGPGGEFSNPQELLIMWTIMNRVGVLSFRPCWEEPITSPANSFLWRLAAAIFIQLVKCGQYDNVTSEDSNFDVVFGALKKHARQSLQRIVRERNEWPAAKIKASKKTCVRQQRVWGMKVRRKAMALSLGLPLLCNVIDHCCSDDESDFEDEPSGSSKKIFRVKKLAWRSAELQTLIFSLEAHRSKQKEISPKGTQGVRPTERIRGSDMALSQVKAPPGLPIDCYDQEWLKDLEENHADQYEVLQVDPTPILPAIETRAYNVLKIKKLFQALRDMIPSSNQLCKVNNLVVQMIKAMV
ncbi:uncharacterized protein MELLADRAFT_96091 [Melampsora larici-populina 98AG31]|uniref:Uncharacterized protein n=1 Tax=Melampsora larici-populina (strain 98AG31 / pathotype 3-4-7) TaxID=747676 RepID=F4SAX4_MELLP|nr:uncharacterized protein MELLADRAFT_96091 [Melampsora larici-populina 98AG31]EGF98181.1 hypothetical protein MELLADRAFT_96091 [Melampsora larici-populina 98AG31]